jgi:hypothetical protein
MRGNINGMSFIKISDKQSLNVNAVESFDVSTREVEKETLLESRGYSGISKVTSRITTQQAVLKITTKKGHFITLYGSEADRAHAILKKAERS